MHKLILGHGRDLVAIMADDYKSVSARQQRAQAYLDGDAPILRADLDKARSLLN